MNLHATVHPFFLYVSLRGIFCTSNGVLLIPFVSIFVCQHGTLTNSSKKKGKKKHSLRILGLPAMH